jgi:signal transduction histidine kinase
LSSIVGISDIISKLMLGRFVFIVCLAFSAAAYAQAQLEASAPGVLVIDDSDPDSPFGRELRAHIHSTLERELRTGFALYPEFLDSGVSKPSNDAPALAYVGDKHRTHRIGAIAAIGANATSFALKLREEWWPEVPVIYVSFDDRQTSLERDPNTTGVIARRHFEDLLKAARIVVPHLGRVALVGSTLEMQPYRQHYAREIPQFAGELEIIDLTGLTVEQAKSQVGRLPDDSIIAYLPIYTDASGLIHNPLEALRALAGVANRPIVSDSENLVGKGAVGGAVLSASAIGREVGGQLARVLKGEQIASIAIARGNYTELQFDARQLRRWNISESALPPDAVIRFNEIGAWERYRWQIVTAIAVLLAEGGIIAALLYERRRRRSAETESHQHLLEVTQMDRALTASTMSSSIAHELNQPLTAIMGNSEAALMMLDADPIDRKELKQILQDIRRDDQRAADIIKHLRMLLRHSDINSQDVDLTSVLKEMLPLIESQAEESATKVKADISEESLHVRADSVHVQQVVLNLAMNAMQAMQDRPEDGRLLELRLDKTALEAVVSISDTGSGIPADKIKTIFNPFVTTKPEGTGLGLSIARTIINTYGGKIWVDNNTKHGATFKFSLRLAAA